MKLKGENDASKYKFNMMDYRDYPTPHLNTLVLGLAKNKLARSLEKKI